MHTSGKHHNPDKMKQSMLCCTLQGEKEPEASGDISCNQHAFEACRIMKSNDLDNLILDLKDCAEILGSLQAEDVKQTQNMQPVPKRVLYLDYLEYDTSSLKVREEWLKTFHENWKAGNPVVVRNCKTPNTWNPETMERSMRKVLKNRSCHTVVINSTDGEWTRLKIVDFFHYYQNPDDREAENVLWKLKDWPADKKLLECIPRLCWDFFLSLPFQEYNFPTVSSLSFVLL